MNFSTSSSTASTSPSLPAPSAAEEDPDLKEKDPAFVADHEAQPEADILPRQQHQRRLRTSSLQGLQGERDSDGGRVRFIVYRRACFCGDSEGVDEGGIRGLGCHHFVSLFLSRDIALFVFLRCGTDERRWWDGTM